MPGRRPPTKPTKKYEWKLEIVYEYHPTDRHTREHWMYCDVSGDSPDECKEKAKKYYETQIRSLGWGKITTLKEIKPLTNVSDPAKRKTNSELSGARNPDKSSPSKSKPRKGTGTSKRRTKSDQTTGTDTKKPKGNRKASSTTKRSSGTPKATGGRGRTGKKRS